MSCSVCWKGGIANHPRILKIESRGGVPNAPILVIDDMPHDAPIDDWDRDEDYWKHYWRRISFTRTALERVTQGVPFTYTQAVRCQSVVVADSDIDPVIACAVWTHNLTDGRKLIMTGEHGFRQMGIEGDFKLHSFYNSRRLGAIFTIGETDMWGEMGYFEIVETKMQQALKKGKLI